MKYKIFLTVFIAGTLSSYGAITNLSTNVPTSSGFFTDGAADFFGIVDTATTTTTGTLVGGGNYLIKDVFPIAGYLIGRDHDDADTRPGTLQATWSLSLPSNAAFGTGLTNIKFSGTLAAAQGGWDGKSSSGNVPDSIKFELIVDGIVTATMFFASDSETSVGSLRLDTNGDDIGDALQISATGITFTPSTNNPLSNAGGASVTSVQLRGTFASDSSDATYWTFGTLSADYDLVPEPSSALLFGIGAVGLIARRSRNGHKS